MLPFEKLSNDDAKNIEYILTDIDDTLTNRGRILPEAYQTLWNLYNQGVKVIPVTGRPAGWCDLIVRLWPVEGVIGENGAFVFYKDKDDDKYRSFVHPAIPGEDVRYRLQNIQEAVLREVKGSRLSTDQFARLYDIAIDFNEDPPYLGYEAAARIKEICEKMGAVAKISSIHVNAWFGEYDKLAMTKLFLNKHYALNETMICKKVLFCGDSPNDEPMFAYFPHSVGVANIMDFTADSSSTENSESANNDGKAKLKKQVMEHFPAYITKERGGLGFAELGNILLKKKTNYSY